MNILQELPVWAFPVSIGLFLLVNLIVGLYQGRHLHSMKSYALADKKMSTGTLAITIIATMIGAKYVTNILTAFQRGSTGGILQGTLVFVLLLILLVHFVFPLLLEQANAYTLGDIMGQLYGKGAQVVTGLISLLTSLVLFAAQLIVIGEVCEALHINKVGVMVSMGIILTIYTWLGGIRSVAATDVLQFLCVAVGFLFIVYQIFRLEDGNGKAIGSLQGLVALIKEKHGSKMFAFYNPNKFWLRIGSGIQYLAFLFSAPIINRVLVARNTAQVRRAFYGAALFFVLIRACAAIIGLGLLFAHGKGKIAENTAFLVMAKSFFMGSPWALVLLLLMLFGVVMSTADSFLNAMVVVVTQDMIQPFRKTKQSLPLKKVVPLFSLLLGILGTLMALLFKNSLVANLVSLTAIALVVFLVPLLLYALRLKPDARVFWISIFTFLILSGIIGWLGHMGYIYLGNLAKWQSYSFRSKMRTIPLFVLPLTFVVSLASHFLIHRGWVLRPKRYSARDWKLGKDVVSLSEFFKSPRSWAADQMATYGSLPVLIGMFLSLSWMVPELTAPQPDPKNLQVLFWVRLIGVSLCLGLILHDRWGARAKAYFPLYYYFTLAYGFPFSYTISFMYNPNNSINTIFFFIAIMLLVLLVNRATFLLFPVL